MPDETIKRVRKYLDWKSWLVGLYTHTAKASTGAFLAFTGTNVAEAIAPVHFAQLGMSWKQALVAGAAALIIEAARYINAKPLPDEKEAETVSPIPPK